MTIEGMDKDILCQEIGDSSALVERPLASVNMMTYNHAPYIVQAIEGVLQQQTDFPLELVIGEDCSSDGTREIVFEYQKEHPRVIRVITSEQNVGPRENSNRVEKACRGKYIAYCEGDDYWHDPRKLQKQIEFLESHPDYGLIHSEVRMYSVESGHTIENLNRFQKAANRTFGNGNGDLFFEILVQNYKIRTCSVCVRKELLDRVVESDPVVFKSDRFMMGDITRWLELSRLTKFKYIDEPLATYNELPESLSHSRDIEKRMRFRLSRFDRTLYYAEKYGYTEKLPQRWWDDYTRPLLSYCYDNQDVATAVMLRERTQHLPLVQILLYWGSINPVIHFLLWPLVYSKRSVSKLVAVLRI